MANEVLFLRAHFLTVATSEAYITLRFMIILDMRLELSFFCGSFPRTEMGVVWALLRFFVRLQMPSNRFLAQRLRMNMNRSHEPQFSCSILFVGLTAVSPRAIKLIVQNWSSAIMSFDCGVVPGIVRNQRVLRNCILVGRE
jgi:hypothetical protein